MHKPISEAEILIADPACNNVDTPATGVETLLNSGRASKSDTA